MSTNQAEGGKKQPPTRLTGLPAAKANKQSEPSTPANVKRLQLNKWFNSPTDNLFSPVTRKLYNHAKKVTVSAMPMPLSVHDQKVDASESGDEEKDAAEEQQQQQNSSSSQDVTSGSATSTSSSSSSSSPAKAALEEKENEDVCQRRLDYSPQ